jgi:hypothetical protein
MLLVDDLLVRPFVSLVDVIHQVALEEMYDTEALRDDLKENQLLYELGERSSEEYERRKAEIEDELALAEEVHDQLTNGTVEVKR